MRRMSLPEIGRNEGVLGRARRGGRAQNSAYLSSARIERGFRSVYRGVSRNRQFSQRNRQFSKSNLAEKGFDRS